MSSNNNVYNCHLRCGHEPRQTCFRSAPRLFAKESCGAGTVSLKGMGEMKEQCFLYPQKGTAHCILGGRL